MTPRAPGIYIIRQTTTNRVYVGSAINLRVREATHFRQLRAGTHCNLYMQRAFTKDPGSFEFIVAVECTRDELLVVEQAYLDVLHDGQQRCFNASPTAGSPAGYEHTVDARKKIRASHAARGHDGISAFRGRWRVRATIGGRQRHVGVFDTREAAEKAARRFVTRPRHGDTATLKT